MPTHHHTLHCNIHAQVCKIVINITINKINKNYCSKVNIPCYNIVHLNERFFTLGVSRSASCRLTLGPREAIFHLALLVCAQVLHS